MGNFSIIGEPYYPHEIYDSDDFMRDWPFPIQEFTISFSHCFTNLTRFALPVRGHSDANRAVYKTIRTVYLALNGLRMYIRMSPFTQNNIQLAGVLFNAILEVVGLPCLNIDFGSEEWAWYTLKAADGDLDSLLRKVLELMIGRLYDGPPS